MNNKNRTKEEDIYQSKKDWEDCFESITDMITIHDQDYNIIRANKAAKALLKLPALEKKLKSKCFSFYHGADEPPAGCPSCNCLKSGLPGVFEFFEPYLNRYLEIRAIPRFDSNNQRVGLIHVVRDITERKQAEQKELIFERFRQGSESLTRNYEGADLGLSIAKAYVEMLGGKIWVESEEGKGSVFYFTIPYNADHKETKLTI